MRNILLLLAVGLGLLGTGGLTQAATQKAAKPSIERVAEPAVCQGNRRSYRNFTHCWRVNRAARYCSRVCNG
jgi:hypothetical protein